MPVTTRNGRKTPQATMEQEIETDTAFSQGPTVLKPSPYYLLFYLLLLILGSLYSILSPDALPVSDPTPLAAGITSGSNTPVSPASVSYFAGKKNFVNLYFVKIGWFWTTLAFLLLHSTNTPSSSSSKSPQHYIQAATRYALVTISWICTTQWFFGPALIDRSFTITGGHCEAKTPATDPVSSSVTAAAFDLTTFATSAACKSAGGHWRGGHDISGHIFMLVLSSAFLLLEMYLVDMHSSHPHISPRAAASLAHEMTEEERKSVGGWESETAARMRVWTRYLVWAVVVLDMWMILMTAIWFHTWPEKLSGLMLSAGTIWVVYWLPEFVPAWRSVVGGLSR